MIVTRLGLLCLFFLTIGFAASSYAEQIDNSNVVVGRYRTVQNTALSGQTDLLKQTFQVRFPYSIRTVKAAVNYLLRFSGYRLVNDVSLPTSAQSFLSQALPEVDRSLGPLTLQDGLLTLVGHPFGLLVDPVHRLVSLYLLPAYYQVYQINTK